MTPLIYTLLFVLGSASHNLRSYRRPVEDCITVRGPDGYGTTGESCVFPFIFQGVTYNACTNAGEPDDTMWCSTKTDKCDLHITGQWGYCSKTCHSEPDDETVWINPITYSPTVYPTSSPTISY